MKQKHLNLQRRLNMWTPFQVSDLLLSFKKKLILPTPSAVRCATISHISAGKTFTYYCDVGMLGRFVTIFIPGEKKTLTLCEVEVYASPTGTTCN